MVHSYFSALFLFTQGKRSKDGASNEAKTVLENQTDSM